MGEAGGDDEGEGENGAAEQSPGGKAVAGGKEVLHDRELGEGVGAEQLLVAGQILAGRIEVGHSQGGMVGAEKGVDRQRPDPGLLHLPGTGRQRQAGEGDFALPGGRGGLGGLTVLDEMSDRHRPPARRGRCRNPEGRLDSGQLGIPTGTCGQKGACRRNGRGHPVGRVLIVEGRVRHRVGEPAVVANLEDRLAAVPGPWLGEFKAPVRVAGPGDVPAGDAHAVDGDCWGQGEVPDRTAGIRQDDPVGGGEQAAFGVDNEAQIVARGFGRR